MAISNEQIASEVLKAIGGKENITSVTHCMTRLRFNLKDESLVEDETVKGTKGVLGLARSAGQVQIIIGQNVDKVYKLLCKEAGISEKSLINENLDGVKKPLTLKNIGTGIMDGLSGSLTPVIPVMLTASIFKMLVAVFGPDMLGILSTESNLYTLFTFVGDAGFYFFPVLLGYTAAKKFGVTPVMGIFLGGIMLHPTFTQLATDGAAFTVYGIPTSVQSYSSTVLPIIMSVYVMSHVEKFFKKVIPQSLKVLFVPVLTMVVMLPVTLCVLGPAGAFLGKYICAAIIAFSGMFGFIGAAVIGALWEFLVMTGMHHVMITQMIMVMAETGYDPVITLGAVAASFAVPGMCLGVAFTLKDKEEKSLSLSYVVASLIGGVTEPGLYGVGVRYKKPFIGMAIGGFCGALYAGIMGVNAYVMVPVANFIAVTGFAGGSSANFINGIISGIIAFAAATIATYFICREKK